MKLRPLLVSIAIIALIVVPAVRCSGDVDDTAVDRFFSAMRDGKFSAATAHFSLVMQAALPAEVLGNVWTKTFGGQGRLASWKIIGRENVPGGDELTVELTFEHSTAISTMAVASQTGEIGSLYFKPPKSSAPISPPPYADASKYRSEDVSVGDGAGALPGTLTIPNGAGPFPAAILVHGSGPQDRNETVGANHPFADLAEGLSSRGIIVLRYDKRTYLHSDLAATVDAEVIDDAVAAVKRLRERKDVASDKIFVIGHSLGAVLAPEIAKKAWPVAGVIMLAPSGRKLPEIVVQQMRLLGQASPAEMAEIERQANLLSAHRMAPTEKFLGAPASYFYDLDGRDEVAIARTLDVPILILHGGRDYQVIDADIQHWQTGLKGVARVRFAEFPALNHLFIAGAGKPGPAEYEVPGHVDVSVVGAIAEFIETSGAHK